MDHKTGGFMNRTDVKSNNELSPAISLDFSTPLPPLFDGLRESRKYVSPSEYRTIHWNAVEACKELKNKELELIHCLQEVDACLVYRYMGYKSLFQYSVQA